MFCDYGKPLSTWTDNEMKLSSLIWKSDWSTNIAFVSMHLKCNYITWFLKLII
jgi:hypothetical protein